MLTMDLLVFKNIMVLNKYENNTKIYFMEYISADLGPERGPNSLPTFVPVKKYLDAHNFSLISQNHQRDTALFKNNIDRI